MLNDTLGRVSDAEYRLIGTDTRPKEIVALPMERAAISEGGGKRE
jgi:hypothetical protein